MSGTKRHVANEREVLVARGRSDRRTFILVPEVKSGHTTGLTLLQVRVRDRLPAEVMRGVLQGYDHRYDRLVDWVTETEGDFDERLLGELPVDDLLILPISDTANHWVAEASPTRTAGSEGLRLMEGWVGGRGRARHSTRTGLGASTPMRVACTP